MRWNVRNWFWVGWMIGGWAGLLAGRAYGELRDGEVLAVWPADQEIRGLFLEYQRKSPAPGEAAVEGLPKPNPSDASAENVSKTNLIQASMEDPPKSNPGEAAVEDLPKSNQSKAPGEDLPHQNPGKASAEDFPKLNSSEAGKEPPPPEAPAPPETTSSVEKLFEIFLEKPTGENYLKVLDALCRHPAYNPYSTELEEVAALVEKRLYKEAKAKLDAAMPNLLLSPRAHNYYRLIAEGLGDVQEAQRQDQIAQKCLQGIQATGRGLVDAVGGESKQEQVPTAPFQVARVSDEYDFVRALGKRTRVHSQSLRRVEGRWYDVLRCSDETGQGFYVWFDVTRPMTALKRQIQQVPSKEPPP